MLEDSIEAAECSDLAHERRFRYFVRAFLENIANPTVASITVLLSTNTQLPLPHEILKHPHASHARKIRVREVARFPEQAGVSIEVLFNAAGDVLQDLSR